MQPKHSLLLYVNDPLASVEFYKIILNADALEVSSGFAMFLLNENTMLGLWEKTGVEPTPKTIGGAVELGFISKDKTEVDVWYKKWKSAGIPTIQNPTSMDFGYTFTAVDPDGHRLRVFATS
jgi:predicted enzyme related to lactoylglutathione lyase